MDCSSVPIQSVTLEGYSGAIPAGPLVSFNCQPSNAGFPSPTYEWFKNDVSVSTNQRYNFSPTPGDNQAVIRCEATNSAGTVSDQVTISVNCKSSQ